MRERTLERALVFYEGEEQSGIGLRHEGTGCGSSRMRGLRIGFPQFHGLALAGRLALSGALARARCLSSLSTLTFLASQLSINQHELVGEILT